MIGDDQPRAVAVSEHFPPGELDGLGGAEQRALRDGPQCDDDSGRDSLNFLLEPHPARRDFMHLGSFVQPASATWLPFKMFDGVRDVQAVAAQAGGFQDMIEQATRWPDERTAAQVFFVARLLAHHHDRRLLGAFAQHGLRGMLPQITTPASDGRVGGLRDFRPSLRHRARQRGLAFLRFALQARAAFVQQHGNLARIRQMPPISLRHFALHVRGVNARHVADVPVVSAPECFVRVSLRKCRTIRRVDIANLIAVPHGSAVRRGDDPLHVRKASDEKWRAELQNLVRRLEPGHITFRAILPCRFAEAHERVHLVNVAMDGFRHLESQAHIRVGVIFEQCAVREGAPREAIHQLPSAAVPVVRDLFQELDQLSRQGHRRFGLGFGGRHRGGIGEQAGRTRIPPQHFGRRNARG